MTLIELKATLEQNKLSKQNPSCRVKYKNSLGEENTYLVYFNPDSEENPDLPSYFIVNLSEPRHKQKNKAVYNVQLFKKKSGAELEEDKNLIFYAFEENGKFILLQSFIKAVNLIKEKIQEILKSKKYDELNKPIYTTNPDYENFHIVCRYNAKIFNHEYFVIDRSRKAFGTNDFFIANKINPETGCIYDEEWAVKILPDGHYKFIQNVPGINVKAELKQLSADNPSRTTNGYRLIRTAINERPLYFAVQESSSATEHSWEPAFLIDEESGLIEQRYLWVDHKAKIDDRFVINTGFNTYIVPSVRTALLEAAKQQGPAFATTPVIIENEAVHIFSPDNKVYIDTKDKFKLFEFLKENLFNPDLDQDTLSEMLAKLSLELRLHLSLIVKYEKNFIADLNEELYSERKNLLLNLLKADLHKVEDNFFKPKTSVKKNKSKWDFFNIFSSNKHSSNNDQFSLERKKRVDSIINTIKIFIYDNVPAESNSIIREFFSEDNAEDSILDFHGEILSEAAKTLVTFLNEIKPSAEDPSGDMISTPIPAC